MAVLGIFTHTAFDGVPLPSTAFTIYHPGGTSDGSFGSVTVTPSFVLLKSSAIERCSTSVTWVKELGRISRILLIGRTSVLGVKVARAPSGRSLRRPACSARAARPGTGTAGCRSRSLLELARLGVGLVGEERVGAEGHHPAVGQQQRPGVVVAAHQRVGDAALSVLRLRVVDLAP